MQQEFEKKCLTHLGIFHKIQYTCFILFFIWLRWANLSNGLISALYYCVSAIVFLLLDTLLLRKGHVFDDFWYGAKCMIEILVYTAGCYFTDLTVTEYLVVLVFQLVLLFEFVVFNSVFDNYYLNAKRVAGILAIFAGLLPAFHHFHVLEWIIIDFTAMILIGAAIWHLTDFLIIRMREYDRQNVSLNYENVSLQEDNKKLIEYQERLKDVNNEINYQKFNLGKMNSELNRMNDEIRSQIEVMKSFSSGFDVTEDMNLLTDVIMQSKEPSVCAFYIAKDVYMNKKPNIVVKTELSETTDKDMETFEKIFALIVEQNILEPIALIEDFQANYDFCKDKALCDVVVFPAYENEAIYGFLMVASNKKNFFASGYAYYESFLMEFSSALRSTKLYLQMQDIARKDGLTGIYNRVYFNKIFTELCRKADEEHSTLAVALFDIDKFKSVNDTYGHLAGDEVIKMVAGVDQEFAEKYNGIACRYGGEEFLLILPGKTSKEAMPLLEKLHEKIKTTKVKFEDYTIDVNVSIGLAVFPETCDSTQLLMSHADATMYYAKRNGRGRLVLDNTY